MYLLLLQGLVLAQQQEASPDKAIEMIQGGRAKAAVEILTRLVEREPSHASYWNLLGIAEAETGEVKAAKKAFQKGLALTPQSPELNENAGLLSFREADYTSAKRYLARAIQLGSNKPGVLFSLAAAKLRTGESAEALTELKSLEPALSENSDYWHERGRAELISDPSEAANSFDRALTLSPNSVVALNEAASAAEREGLDEKALAYLLKARTADPNDEQTLVHFGSVCIRRDLGLDARDALQKALQFRPADSAALYLLARANISLQNWQEAYDLFNRFSKLKPAFAPTYYAMGWLDIRLNRLDDARKQLRQAIAIAPTFAGPIYELAELEFKDGHMEAAERLLRPVIAKNPGDSKANMLLGDIMMRMGKLAEAQQCLNAAVRQDPSLAAAHYKLSVLLFRMHEPQQAGQEKDIAAKLTAEEKKASRTQLRLVLPEMEHVEHP